MKFGGYRVINDYLRKIVHKSKLIDDGHFVSHLGYRSSNKTCIKIEQEYDGNNPYMKFGRNPIKND